MSCKTVVTAALIVLFPLHSYALFDLWPVNLNFLSVSNDGRTMLYVADKSYKGKKVKINGKIQFKLEEDFKSKKNDTVMVTISGDRIVLYNVTLSDTEDVELVFGDIDR